MLLLVTLLLLAALVDQSLGKEEVKGSGVPLEIRKEIVDRHNEIRRKVNPSARNMLKVVWDEAVGERARQWVNQCKQEMSPKDSREGNGTICGEIIFQANYINSWTEVIKFWNGKKANFKYGVGKIDPGVNIYPYTQLIWYNSYRVGCAAAYCPNTKFPYFYICQYCPAGNFDPDLAKPYKKGPACGDCPNNCEKKLCTNPCKYSDASRDCKRKKRMFTCQNPALREECRGTCSCKKEIV
ncbi:cysteine-rich venom protein piscivorin-like [Heteronotia binoei]|uniref:cysteine-rich venom protein piscivorin-like n=1 Tax=Heteronotia binoei TaxID=13085 RepID=UPI0029305072|nr:cysteine-rich venom protein piscivorin-like [Heteronotia binoei]